MNRILELAKNAVCIYSERKSNLPSRLLSDDSRGCSAEVILKFDNKEDASEFYDMVAYGLNNDGSVV